MTLPLPIKLVGEVITVKFNFLTQIEWGETLSAPVVTIEVFSGLDYNPAALLSGTASALGSVVSQKIQQGLPGVIYNLVCTATGSTGNVYQVVRPLAILDPDGQFTSGALPALTGILPDGVVGAAYSAPLTISGGYPPYFPDGIASGTAPIWMFFSVVDNTLHCTGLPDEPTGPTNYIFSPQIVDNTGGQADAPQDITITRITASGDLPDGEIGNVVNFNYTAIDGTAPYTFAIFSGALPDGLSMNSAGNVTGTLTTAGSFSWVVRATDVNGIFDDVPDTCVVVTYAFVVIQDTPTASDVFKSTSATTWGDHVPSGLGANCWSLFGGGSRLFVFAQAVANGRVSADGASTWKNVTGITSTAAKNGMAYCEPAGAWVIAVHSGTEAYRSTNGTDFSPVTVASRTYYQGAALGNTIIFNSTLANLIRSTDGGVSFSAAFSNGIITCEQAVDTTNAFLIAGEAGQVLKSTTGAPGTWSSVLVAGYSIQGMACDGTRVMILGEFGQSHYSDAEGDSGSWIAGPTIPNFNTAGGSSGNLTYGNGLFVAAGGYVPGNSYSGIFTTPSSGTPVWTLRFSLLSANWFDWIASAIKPDQG